jgi:hypothetical protein
MSHDQLSKSLLETFFPDFLRLTAPDSAPDSAKKSWSTGSRPA